MDPEKILAALKTLGPSSPRALADHLKVDPGKLSYHLRTMLAAKTIQASGTTSGRLYALPGQKIDGATPPPSRKKHTKKAKGKHRKSRAARQATTAPAAESATAFVPAYTADGRLVIVADNTPPQIFSTAQTEAVAQLLGNYWS